MTKPNNRAIGVFDSGLGGLTVVRAIRSQLPNESIVYLGDTARVPYGSRTAHTVIRYARGCAAKLVERDIKLLVVACNTVSAVALSMLRVELDMPVLGVIEPGARAGTQASKSHIIGVLATEGTVQSGAYTRAISTLDTRAETVSNPAPLLVPLVEEGWVDGEVPRLAARRYLTPLIKRGVDAVVLGCTHYPLLKDLIAEEAEALRGKPVAIVDSAEAAAQDLASLLNQRNLMADTRPDANEAPLSILVTDLPKRFQTSCAQFLGKQDLGDDGGSIQVEQVDL